MGRARPLPPLGTLSKGVAGRYQRKDFNPGSQESEGAGNLFVVITNVLICKCVNTIKSEKRLKKKPRSQMEPKGSWPLWGICSKSMARVRSLTRWMPPPNTNQFLQTLESDVNFIEFGGVSCIAQHAEKLHLKTPLQPSLLWPEKSFFFFPVCLGCPRLPHTTHSLTSTPLGRGCRGWG